MFKRWCERGISTDATYMVGATGDLVHADPKNKGLVSKATVMLSRCGSETRKFGLTE